MPATGKVTQVIGSTFDCQFPEDQLPDIYNALTLPLNYGGEAKTLTGEVQQHLGGGRVRAVALGSTDGLARGVDVTDTGAPSRSRSARRRSAACSTCSASRSTSAARSTHAPAAARSTATRPSSPT
jgi:hypothetical protein